MIKKIDVNLCNKLFEYRDGKLIRKITTSHNAKAGEVAGCVDNYGYRRIDINGQKFRASRIIYAMHFGDPADKQIDHINHNRSDDRIENLRIVTTIENQRNRAIDNRNTSGITGVGWYKPTKKWVARIKVNGKQITCGYFNYLRAAVVERKYQEIRYGFHEKHGA